MPELPEVETVCRGLAPVLAGAVLDKIVLRRKSLRFVLPPALGRVRGVRVTAVARRAKYVLVYLENGQTVIVHLGMSGRMLIYPPDDKTPFAPHDHVVFYMQGGGRVVLNDPRRFGMVDLAATAALPAHRFFAHLGPEPLSEDFSAAYLQDRFGRRKAAAVKTVLMDQKIVVGVGNIYAAEALHTARIHPLRLCGALDLADTRRLVRAVRATLEKAIAAGGSSLRDYVQTDGALGYFQHQWRVYGRAGQACRRCGAAGIIEKVVQAGRATYFCSCCQA